MSTQQLLIEVELPEGDWAGDLTRAQPSLVIRYEELMLISATQATARVTLLGDADGSGAEAIAAHANVTQFDLYGEGTAEQRGGAVVFENAGHLGKPIQQARIIPQTPFDVRSGRVVWAVATSKEQASTLLKVLKDEQVGHTVRSYGQPKERRLLTARQREVFDEALRMGYYDAPRKLTLTQLAGELSMSKSTLCEMLHLIEYQIISTFSEDVREQSPLPE